MAKLTCMGPVWVAETETNHRISNYIMIEMADLLVSMTLLPSRIFLKPNNSNF
jgi:hypothetical protein